MNARMSVVLMFLPAIMMLLPFFCDALTWGVGGHPGNDDLWGNRETQLATLERYGLKTYRFDVKLVGDNKQVADELHTFITLAHLHHVTLHTIL